MVKISSGWEEKRVQILDQVAPILQDLKSVLSRFDEPEAGYFGTDAMYIRLFSNGLVIEHGTIDAVLQAAKKHDAVISVDTKHGPLVVTIMKHENIF